MGAADLLLQLDDAVDQGFRRGGAARHIDIDRHDAVAATHHGIAVVVVAAAIGARVKLSLVLLKLWYEKANE